MSGYIKKIAVIRGIKSGFSADGGNLSGLIKMESYAGFIKVELSLINFAPLSEGEYIFGITNGRQDICFSGDMYEEENPFDLTCGFAALICFRHGELTAVASGVCGNLQSELNGLLQRMQADEKVINQVESAFDDEAIAEVNYYELQTDENGDAVCADKAQAGGGDKTFTNEENISSLPQGQSAVGGEQSVADSAANSVVGSAANGAAGSDDGVTESSADDAKNADEKPAINLAGGDYYSTIKERVEGILASYPQDEQLMGAISGSRWAKISYADGKYYSFGMIELTGGERYICYALPLKKGDKADTPPQSLKGKAAFVATQSGGYFVLFQDAATGALVGIDRG